MNALLIDWACAAYELPGRLNGNVLTALVRSRTLLTPFYFLICMGKSYVRALRKQMSVCDICLPARDIRKNCGIKCVPARRFGSPSPARDHALIAYRHVPSPPPGTTLAPIKDAFMSAALGGLW